MENKELTEKINKLSEEYTDYVIFAIPKEMTAMEVALKLK